MGAADRLGSRSRCVQSLFVAPQRRLCRRGLRPPLGTRQRSWAPHGEQGISPKESREIGPLLFAPNASGVDICSPKSTGSYSVWVRRKLFLYYPKLRLEQFNVGVSWRLAAVKLCEILCKRRTCDHTVVHGDSESAMYSTMLGECASFVMVQGPKVNSSELH